MRRGTFAGEANGGKRSQMAAITGVFEDFGHGGYGVARREGEGRGGGTVRQRKGRRRGLVVHKNAEKFKIVLIVEKFC